MYRLGLGLGQGWEMGFIPSFFFSALKSDEHLMQRCHLWCGVTYCGFHPAPSSPTPMVGHVTGDMKRCESNETVNDGWAKPPQ